MIKLYSSDFVIVIPFDIRERRHPVGESVKADGLAEIEDRQHDCAPAIRRFPDFFKGRLRPRTRTRPRIRVRGVLESWSIGVVR
jgi:hypothetical protein